MPGFAVGITAGGLVGGPVGAIVGGLLGTIIGLTDMKDVVKTRESCNEIVMPIENFLEEARG